MLLSKARGKGIFDLYGLVIVGGIITTIIVLLISISFVSNIVGIRNVVKLTVDLDDSGSRINGFLDTRKSELSFKEIIGNFRAGEPGDVEGLKETLNKLRWNLVVRDELDKDIGPRFGNVRESKGEFVQVALPGLRRGKIGVDIK